MLEAEGISCKNLKIIVRRARHHAVPQGFRRRRREAPRREQDRHHEARHRPVLPGQGGAQGHPHPGPAGREDLPPEGGDGACAEEPHPGEGSTACTPTRWRRSARSTCPIARILKPYVAETAQLLNERLARRQVACCSRARRARCSTSTTARTPTSRPRRAAPAAPPRARAWARRPSIACWASRRPTSPRVGERPVPHGAALPRGRGRRRGGRGRRTAVLGGPRVRRDHGAQAPLRLVRRGHRALRCRGQRPHRRGAHQTRRAFGLRHHQGVHGLRVRRQGVRLLPHAAERAVPREARVRGAARLEGRGHHRAARTFEELPENAQRYVEYLEKITGVPVSPSSPLAPIATKPSCEAGSGEFRRLASRRNESTLRLASHPAFARSRRQVSRSTRRLRDPANPGHGENLADATNDLWDGCERKGNEHSGVGFWRARACPCVGAGEVAARATCCTWRRATAARPTLQQNVPDLDVDGRPRRVLAFVRGAPDRPGGHWSRSAAGRGRGRRAARCRGGRVRSRRAGCPAGRQQDATARRSWMPTAFPPRAMPRFDATSSRRWPTCASWVPPSS